MGLCSWFGVRRRQKRRRTGWYRSLPLKGFKVELFISNTNDDLPSVVPRGSMRRLRGRTDGLPKMFRMVGPDVYNRYLTWDIMVAAHATRVPSVGVDVQKYSIYKLVSPRSSRAILGLK